MSADEYPAGICPRCGVPRGAVLDEREVLRGIVIPLCRSCEAPLVIRGTIIVKMP